MTAPGALPASASLALTAAGLLCVAGEEPAEVAARVLDGSPAGAAGRPGLLARELAEFSARRYVPRKGIGHLSRTSQLACAAASRLAPALAAVAAERVGVVLGTAWASLDTVVRFEREAHTEGPRLVDPLLFTETVSNVPAGQVSIVFGWSAVNATVCSGTASGIEALALSSTLLRERRADVVVAGGADELNVHLLRVLASRAHDTVGSEGACLLALERPEHARARGARALGLLTGVTSCFVGQEEEGREVRIAERLLGLLHGTGLDAQDVDLVVLASGPAVLHAAVLERVFGRGPRPRRLSLSGVLGETWGAAGPLGVVVALETLRRESGRGCAVVLSTAGSGQFGAVALRGGDA